MKKIVAITLLSLICASAAFAQVKPRVNTKGEKINHISDSLIIVYSPDSIKINNSWKKHPAKVEVFSSESDTSFHYDYTMTTVPGKKEVSVTVNDDRMRRGHLIRDMISACRSTARSRKSPAARIAC